MRTIILSLALFSSLYSFQPAFAAEPSIVCPCKCAENWAYRFIRITPSSVGLPPSTERFELFYHVEQACHSYCKRTTGRPDSSSLACI